MLWKVFFFIHQQGVSKSYLFLNSVILVSIWQGFRRLWILCGIGRSGGVSPDTSFLGRPWPRAYPLPLGWLFIARRALDPEVFEILQGGQSGFESVRRFCWETWWKLVLCLVWPAGNLGDFDLLLQVRLIFPGLCLLSHSTEETQRNKQQHFWAC